jgi:hypothetical protein
MGLGRSYGTRSRVLARTLPGILTCGLWEALAARPDAATAVLVTDVGNDLLFGATPDLTAHWVEQCLVRLRRLASEIVMTELPLRSLEKVGVARFLLLRTMLFPASRLAHHEALARARRLNDHVRGLAQKYEAHLVTPRACWYGLDPLHIRRREQGPAWREIFSCWSQREPSLPRGLSLRDRWRLRGLRPHQRQLFGIERTHPQPAARLGDGTLVSWY